MLTRVKIHNQAVILLTLLLLSGMLGTAMISAKSNTSARFYAPLSYTIVEGHIVEDTTWTLDGSPYVVTGDVIIDSGVTLTIQPGVVVKFEYVGYGDKRSIEVNGVLNAVGTAGQPIVFTSSRDDSYAGDTNGDGYATSPAPGDWGYIKFNAAGSTFQYCIVRYGGIGYRDGNPVDRYMIWVNATSLTVRNVLLEKSHGVGLYIYRGSGTSNVTVEFSTFRNNEVGIRVEGP